MNQAEGPPGVNLRGQRRPTNRPPIFGESLPDDSAGSDPLPSARVSHHTPDVRHASRPVPWPGPEQDPVGVGPRDLAQEPQGLAADGAPAAAPLRQPGRVYAHALGHLLASHGRCVERLPDTRVDRLGEAHLTHRPRSAFAAGAGIAGADLVAEGVADRFRRAIEALLPQFGQSRPPRIHEHVALHDLHDLRRLVAPDDAATSGSEEEGDCGRQETESCPKSGYVRMMLGTPPE